MATEIDTDIQDVIALHREAADAEAFLGTFLADFFFFTDAQKEAERARIADLKARAEQARAKVDAAHPEVEIAWDVLLD